VSLRVLCASCLLEDRACIRHFSHQPVLCRAVSSPPSPTPPLLPGEVWGGVPARFVRKLTHDEEDALKEEAVDINRAAWAVRKGESTVVCVNISVCQH
jgi:hypothetical protein